jgi:dTDP-4-dehydrorhamnose reductase
LARVIAALISGESTLPYGLYHYSNQGQVSWFEFAREIFKEAGLPGSVEPISSEEFPTKARRPSFSVMSTDKFRQASGLEVPDWKTSLAKALSKRLSR